MHLRELVRIGGISVYVNSEGTYVMFTSGLQICNDGSGPQHGDKTYLPKTAYYNGGKYLNADVDRYIVVPPQIRKLVKPKVMGCQARLTNLHTEVEKDAVVGEIGPAGKLGEAAYCLAKLINPKITHNSGDTQRLYLYELWPGTPALVGAKRYKLEPVG